MTARRLSLYGTLFGGAMITLAVLWAGVVRGVDLAIWFPAEGWAADLVLGTGIGIVTALGVYRLLDLIPAMRQLERLLLKTLDMETLTVAHAIWFGLIAGIPEETLFRGAMQPGAGLIVTALVFGALHALTPMYFLYATAAGMLLGALAEWSGGLWMPIAAHATLDSVMFVLLIARWRRYTPVRHTSNDSNT
jgi:membrane protease YdiL (CAAX protease family)